MKPLSVDARKEREEALAAMLEIVADFFAFQVAACTTQPGCSCGRHHDPR